MWRRGSDGARLRVVETDLEARQGRRGRPVLIVLVISLLLAGALVAGMTLWALREVPPRSAEVSQPAPPVLPSSALQPDEAPPANPAYPVPAVPRVR